VPNVSGKAYGLTVLSPIRNEASQPPSASTRVREFLAGLQVGAASPFACLTAHHFVRFAVIDDVFFESYPAKVDHLQTPYLLFTSDFNGDLDSYLRALVAQAPEVVQGIWGQCYGFPGTDDPARFAAYIRRCQITTTLYFADQADATVDQVLRALDVQARTIRFIEQTQGLAAAPLQEAFRKFMTEVKAAPTPRPGTR
jgi:hypothetical protein